MSKEQTQLKKRALDVLEQTHDLIKKPKGESSSFKTANTLTYCAEEYWSGIGMDEEYVQGDPEQETRPYVYIDFENAKGMGREQLNKLLELKVIKERDVINIDKGEFSITVIGEPL